MHNYPLYYIHNQKPMNKKSNLSRNFQRAAGDGIAVVEGLVNGLARANPKR